MEARRITQLQIRPQSTASVREQAVKADIDFLLQYQQEFVNVPCFFCAGSENSCLYEKHGFKYVRCSACGAIFMNPRPPMEVLRDFYQSSCNYRVWGDITIPLTNQLRAVNFFEPRVERLLTFCDCLALPRNLLLDVGGGYGAFAELLTQRKLFERVLVIEPSADLAKLCRGKGLEVFEDFFENFSVHDVVADVVTAFEVIEHTYDPKAFLHRIFQVLRPGGLVMLSCPNVEGFETLMLKEQSSTVCHEHLNYFTPHILMQMMKNSGFEIVDICTPGQLDADVVRQALLAETLKQEDNLFFVKVLVQEWEKTGHVFQTFLTENLLSSHMLAIGKRVE